MRQQTREWATLPFRGQSTVRRTPHRGLAVIFPHEHVPRRWRLQPSRRWSRQPRRREAPDGSRTHNLPLFRGGYETDALPVELRRRCHDVGERGHKSTLTASATERAAVPAAPRPFLKA